MSSTPSPWVLGARSETGYVRSANEDRMGWTRTPYGDVFVVSDGMGGHLGGALAAEITLRTLQQQLALIPPASDRFADHVRQAFLAANRDVFTQRQADDPLTREMGATGVAMVTDGVRFIVAHVGDSRAYLWRRRNLRQLTRDHTRVQSMVDNGLLSAEQALTHPDASVLDRAIGHEASVEVDVTDWVDLEPADMLLLCSDGLCGYVADAEIASILTAGGDPQACTDRLIDCALGKGGHDNVTVQLVRFAPSGWGVFSRTLARPAFMAPVCVGITAIAALVVGMNLTDSYQKQIQDYRETIRSQAAASAPGSSAASTASTATTTPMASGSMAAAGAAAAGTSKSSVPPTPAAASAAAAPSSAARSPAQPTSSATTSPKPTSHATPKNPVPAHRQPAKPPTKAGKTAAASSSVTGDAATAPATSSPADVAPVAPASASVAPTPDPPNEPK